MQRTLAILRKELLDTFRDRRTGTVTLLSSILAGPIFLMLIFNLMASQAERARASLGFLTGLLGEAQPAAHQGRVPTVEDLLQRGSQRIIDDRQMPAALRAELAATLGAIHIERGESCALTAQEPSTLFYIGIPDHALIPTARREKSTKRPPKLVAEPALAQ